MKFLFICVKNIWTFQKPQIRVIRTDTFGYEQWKWLIIGERKNSIKKNFYDPVIKPSKLHLYIEIIVDMFIVQEKCKSNKNVFYQNHSGNTPCEEEMTKGEGTAALTRFYYDAKQRKCLAFNYLGMKGNRNNFLTKENCEVRTTD